MAESLRALPDVLKLLCLEKYYPEKLTSEDLLEVTELSLSDTSEVTPETISWHFINRLTRYNYNARGLKIAGPNQSDNAVGGYLEKRRKEKHEKAGTLHPLDILLAVFVCCDPVAKQDLVKYLWGCKIAVPFMLYPEEPNSTSALYVWPLRGLISQWQGPTEKLSIEEPIMTYEMKKVAFIRYGESSESKSALINSVIGGPEKAHPIFFHRDMNGSKKQRSTIVEGMFEIGWYLQKGDMTDRFDNCLMFGNLRGDAKDHPKHVKVICQMVNILVVITKTQALADIVEQIKNMLDENTHLRIILVLTDSSIEKHHKQKIDCFLRTLEIETEVPSAENKFEILLFEGQRLAERTETISWQIKLMLSDPTISIESFAHSLTDSSMDMGIYIDEASNKYIRVGMDRSSRITKLIEQIQPLNRKSTCFPLQTELSLHWVNTEQENKRSEGASGESAPEYTDSLDSFHLKKIRKKQLGHMRNLPAASRNFAWYTHSLSKSELRVFLRNLKLMLDQLGRQSLQPFYKEYQDIVSIKSTANKTTHQKLNDDIEKLDKLKTELYVGMEHLCREIGQMYEICDPSSKIFVSDKRNNVPCNLLPSLAAKILLMGYPLEIMDGDAGFVPTKWISAVLLETEKELGRKVRVHIISVLGIQSSGKSTLLNTMFGALFAVSAGRCTKGVFMQMFKLNSKLSAELDCDYIVLIDTEGLRSSKPNCVQFDNEVSCFAIGLADMTIVNLMGENATYLKENLPVVVHAFLRMEMVGLRPLCTIVHHNVDKKDKKKLTEQGQTLERVLDELTEKACSIEKISPIKRFNEIIEFNIDEYTDYVPSLFEGVQPMAPVSLGYSQECDILRRKILNQIQTDSRRTTLGRMQLDLKRLWKAIKKDDFVFRFKSILEAEARIQLDELSCDILRDSFAKIKTFSNDAIETFSKHQNTPINEHDKVKIEYKYDKKCSEVQKDARQKIQSYIDQSPAISRLQWKDETIEHFLNDFEEAKLEFRVQIHVAYDNITHMGKVEGMDKEQREFLRKVIDNEPKLDVQEIWERLKNFLVKARKHGLKDYETGQIETDVSDIILSTFRLYHNLIQDAWKEQKSKTSKRFSEMSRVGKSLYSKYGGSKVTQPVRNFIATHKHEIYEEFVQRIFDVTAEQLDEITQKSAYSKFSVKVLFSELEHIVKCTKVNKKLIVDVLLIVVSEVVLKLSDSFSKDHMVERYTTYLEENKDYYISMIKHLLQPNTSQMFLVEMKAITSVIKKGIVKRTRNTIVREMVKEIASKMSKPLLFTKLLLTAVTRKDTTLMDMYRRHPSESLHHYLTTYFLRADQVLRFCNVITPNIKTDVRKIIPTVPKSIDAESLNVWVCKMMKALGVNDEKLKNGPCFISRDKTITLDKLLDSISEQDIVKAVSRCDYQIKQEISRKIVKDYIGCTECCPFCNEMCKFRNKDHPGPHETLMHRPIATKGYHFVKTKELAIGTCDMFVQSRCTFDAGGGEYIPFRDYKSVYEEWDIRAPISNDDSIYWKWYFVENREAFLSSHKDLELEVPPEWSDFTRNRVIDHLKNKEIEYSSTSIKQPIFKSVPRAQTVRKVLKEK